jgi:O-antigen/teichoic acid export membrane protein
MTSAYRTVCVRKYEECRFQFYWDKELFTTIVKYSGWNLFGAIAGILNNQGVNILLNMFFGPIVNGSRAIAIRVNEAVNQFVMNFLVAVRPQIIKYYAASENQEMFRLLFRSSKMSYFLLLILALPVLLETDYIISIWLEETPQYVVLFTRLVIITALIDSFSYPLMTVAQATGKIKKYQIVVGGMLLLNLPLSYWFLKMGYLPQVTFYIGIIISFICFMLRLWMLRGMVGLSIIDYFKKVIIGGLNVTVVSSIVPYILSRWLDVRLMSFIIVTITSFAFSLFSVFFLGLSYNERKHLFHILKPEPNIE